MLDVKFPEHGGDQLYLLYPYNQNTQITHKLLHEPLLILMDKAGVDLVASACRTKSLKRLGEKFVRSGWKPALDIHAARLVLRRRDFNRAKDVIFEEWPTPEYAIAGIPSFRDYGAPDIRATLNKDSNPKYKAAHINVHVPFGARIAEVQLYTVADYIFYMQTRDEYIQRQREL